MYGQRAWVWKSFHKRQNSYFSISCALINLFLIRGSLVVVWGLFCCLFIVVFQFPSSSLIYQSVSGHRHCECMKVFAWQWRFPKVYKLQWAILYFAVKFHVPDGFPHTVARRWRYCLTKDILTKKFPAQIYLVMVNRSSHKMDIAGFISLVVALAKLHTSS